MENKPRHIPIDRVYAVWPSGDYCLQEDKQEFAKLIPSRKKPMIVYADTPLSELEKFMPTHKAIQFIKETR